MANEANWHYKTDENCRSVEIQLDIQTVLTSTVLSLGGLVKYCSVLELLPKVHLLGDFFNENNCKEHYKSITVEPCLTATSLLTLSRLGFFGLKEFGWGLGGGELKASLPP